MDRLFQGIFIGLMLAVIVWGLYLTHRKRLLDRLRCIREIYGRTVNVYSSAREAADNIKEECLKSRRIRYVGDYNSTFLNVPFPEETLLYQVLAQAHHRHREGVCIQFLHLSPVSDFVEKRAAELNHNPCEIRRGILAALQSVKDIERLLAPQRVSVHVRHYTFQVLLRAIILDHCCFLGFYRPERMGAFSPVLKLTPRSELYLAANRFFDVLWNDFSYPAEEDLQRPEVEEVLN
jgi:hypothetical protein